MTRVTFLVNSRLADFRFDQTKRALGDKDGRKIQCSTRYKFSLCSSFLRHCVQARSLPSQYSACRAISPRHHDFNPCETARRSSAMSGDSSTSAFDPI
ncbi:uncharacterized protein ARMOST_01559 [Armillaria ostoyae]|uniref:Uncharacterized protein n=1 Tax=Armillaria ostoyae TaxID=47428 RepID=A0A284QPA6_ARMOS|nr:uncharacterized protein ARMOST_01559 [Armillaria ostoyae]